MGAPGMLSSQGLIPPLQGKANKKKVVRVYNQAYKQICELWSLLPNAAKMVVPSNEEETNAMEVDDEPSQDITSRNNNIQYLDSQVKLLKGKQASYKEKMAKNKLKKSLRKKMRLKERQVLKEETRKKKKELKLAERMKGVEGGEKAVEKKGKKAKRLAPEDDLVPEEDVSAEEDNDLAPEQDSDEEQQVIREKKTKKNKKQAKIEEKLQQLTHAAQDNQDPLSSGLSKKKLKMKIKQDLKAEKKREKKKLHKMKKKEEAAALLALKSEQDEVKPHVVEKQTSDDVEIMFNKMDLEPEKSVRFKKDKKTEKDPVKALEKIEELNKKISNLKECGLEDKAAAIKSKHSWKTALLKAEGVKVKDDVKMLKKTIKRQENKKNKSQTEWKKRTESKEKRMADAQKKRKDNIMKKKKDKKQNKIKKSIKKGRVVI